MYSQEAAPPAMVAIMDGLGAAPNEFISPHAQNVPFRAFSLEATEALTLTDARVTVTGGAVPGVRMTNDGGGMHTVSLTTPVEVQNWAKIELDVIGNAGGVANTFVVWVAHLFLYPIVNGRAQS